jgi:hypothetical protein
MTKEIEAKFRAQGDTQDKTPEQTKVIAKFFHPFSTWKWYATEYDPKTREFFGLVRGFEEELGPFSLDELESVKVHGLGIERDLYWDSNATLADVQAHRAS